MQKVNLTDQELNEWVNKTFLWGPNPILKRRYDPCGDLNHDRLMEEKIREMGDDKMSEYSFELCKLLDRIGTDFDEIKTAYFDLLHASDRQRCEAAYLTFQEKA